MASDLQAAQQPVGPTLGELRLPLSFAVGAAIAGYPAGAVVSRWRLQYAPRGSQQTSFIGLFKRTQKQEGWAGLYKCRLSFLHLSDISKNLTSVLLGSALVLAQSAATVIPFGIYGFIIQPYLPAGFLAYFATKPIFSSLPATIVASLVALPFEVASARMFASTRSFSIWTPLQNIQALFTRSERKRPLKNLYTLSRLATVILPAVSATIAMAGIAKIASTYPKEQRWLVNAVGRIALSLLAVPFDLLALRLSMQSDHATITNEKEVQIAEEASVVIRKEPYRNLWDCVTRVIQEEGWSTLWRGWPVDVGTVVMICWIGRYTDAIDVSVSQAMSGESVVV